MSELGCVLAATDGTEHGKWAVVTGSGLARRADSDFHIVTVVSEAVPPMTTSLAGWSAGWFSESLAALEPIRRESARDQAREAGAPEAPVHVLSGLVAPLITETVREIDADLLVLGAHRHRALEHVLLGSTAEKVTRMSDRPVLVATEERTRPFQRVLAALDISPQSRRVLETAVRIGASEGADVRALYVQEPLSEAIVSMLSTSLGEVESRVGELEESARGQFQALVGDVRESSGTQIEEGVRAGRAGPGIIKESEEWGADLVVLGTHGHGFVHRLMIGSTSLEVLRHVDRATMLVPRTDPE